MNLPEQPSSTPSPNAVNLPTDGVPYEDDGTRIIPVSLFVYGTAEQSVTGVYAVLNESMQLVYVGCSRDVAASLEAHESQYPDKVAYVRIMTFVTASAYHMKLVADSWIEENNDVPVGNMEPWFQVDQQLSQQIDTFAAVDMETPLDADKTDDAHEHNIISPFASNPVSVTANEQADTKEDNEILPLTENNVSVVLDEVRPYLVADGGNISVADVDSDKGIVKVVLQGACATCSSASTTMSMGVERKLYQRFGTNLKEVAVVKSKVVDMEPVEEYAQVAKMCESALDAIRPILRELGAEVSVIEVDEDEVVLEYDGPNNLKQGIEQTLLERVDGVEVVTFEAAL